LDIAGDSCLQGLVTSHAPKTAVLRAKPVKRSTCALRGPFFPVLSQPAWLGPLTKPGLALKQTRSCVVLLSRKACSCQQEGGRNT